MHLAYEGLFNDYEIIEENGAAQLFIYDKDALRLGDVMYGIVRVYIEAQRAYFVTVGEGRDIYVKAKYMPEHIKVGDGIFVEIISEKIKTKPASGRHYKDDALSVSHHTALGLVKRHRKAELAQDEGLSAIEKFRAKAYTGMLYHKVDMLGVLYQQLSRTHALPHGAELVIDELETLTAIDINAHTYAPKQKGISAAYAVNNASMLYVFGLLNTRRISGTVVIDCLNMPKKEQKMLVDDITAHLNTHRYPYLHNISIKGFTKTGLLELAIQKTMTSLWTSAVRAEGLSYEIKEEIIFDLTLDKLRVSDLKEGKAARQIAVTPALNKRIGDNGERLAALTRDMTLDIIFK